MKLGRVLIEIFLMIMVSCNFTMAWLSLDSSNGWSLLLFVFFGGFGCFWVKALVDCFVWQVQSKSL
jgi:hypothetical protein